MGMVGEDRHGEKGVSTGGRSLGAYDKRQLDCHKRGATSSLLEAKRSEGKRFGLFTRLASHASGRRSGDQFCVYVADFLVLPRLSDDQIDAISRKDLLFDNLVKEYIHSNLDFGFAEDDDGEMAQESEDMGRSGVLGQKPLLNPRN